MNNNPKSNTRQYSTTTYSSRGKRNKKHSQNKLVFYILLALLIIALIVAIVFVIADLVGSGGDEETSGDPAGTEAPGIIADGHPMSSAYDADEATYMLSVTKQSAGSYFSCEFETETPVGSVRLVSSEPDYYIRGCELQLKIDGEWIPVGVFGAGANDKEYNPSLPFSATAVRIVLTENADTLWAINDLSVKDKDGNAVSLRSPAMGTNTPGGDQGEVTTAPGTIGGDTTNPPAPGTTKPIDQGTTTITVSNDRMYEGELILVNAQYAFRFPSSQASLLNVYNE